jgi:transposase
LNKDLIIQLQQQELQHYSVFTKSLQQTNILQQELLDNQILLNSTQGKQIELLLLHVKTLTERIEELENNQKKNSGNSSKPPSTDIGKVSQTKSLRQPSGKLPGGQPGHKGTTLEITGTPDIIEVQRVKTCSCCGKNITGIKSLDYECRQVFDMPAIKLWVKEYRSEIKNCPHCSAVTRASFPAGVSQPVQYGKEIHKLAVYFSNYQLLPYSRTAQLFEDLLGHRISEASLVSMNKRCADNLGDFMTELTQTISSEAVIHADETGYYYNGQRNWLHVLATQQHTLYKPHAKRGKEAMDEMGVLPFYNGRLIHDFWKPYNEYGCQHGLCNVHHLRDLTFCAEIEKSQWAAEMKQLLIDLHKKVETARNEKVNALTIGQISYWSAKYNKLLKAGWEQHPPPKKQKGKRGAVKRTKTQNLLQRFGDYKESIFSFARDFTIPFGNNLAEQAIRMMKVKQKISGCFRSEQGANTFAIIRSYISTMQKQGKPILDALEYPIMVKFSS